MENKNRNIIIATNIKKYIKENNITQKKLAKDIGISPSTMSDYMNLRSNPSHGVIQKIADYFGIMKSDIDSTYKENSSDISSIYNQLNEQRQKIVYRFAEDQLIEQKKGQSDLIDNLNNENNNIYTLAAHSDDPDKNYTDEEIRAIQSELAKIKQAHEAKKKKK